MARLSITTAWNETAAFVRRDFGALFTIALAFSAVPGVALQVLMPETEAQGGIGALATLLLIGLVVAALALVGGIAIAALALGRENVVGAAIRRGFRRLPPLLGASLLIGLILGLVCAPILLALKVDPEALRHPTPENMAAISGVALIILVVGIVLGTRLLLMTSVAAAEQGGPIAIARRSWALTAGHFWKLVGFVVLMLIVYFIISVAANAVFGVIVALIAGQPEPGTLSFLVILLLDGIVSAAWMAGFTTLIARIYAQLAGEPTSGS